MRIIETLGEGDFGRLELVQHKTNSQLVFARKCLKRFNVVQENRIQHVINERDSQTDCNSIFIVRMYNYFKDSRYLYFLMECCLGGAFSFKGEGIILLENIYHAFN